MTKSSDSFITRPKVDYAVYTALDSQIRQLSRPMALSYSRIDRALQPDDFLQEICVKVFLALPIYDANEPFENFVRRIARNACIDLLRSRLHMDTISFAIKPGEPEPDLVEDINDNVALPSYTRDGRLEWNDDSIDAEEHLSCLIPMERRVVCAFFGIGELYAHPVETIARDMGISRPTVYKIMDAALKKMRSSNTKRTVRGVKF